MTTDTGLDTIVQTYTPTYSNDGYGNLFKRLYTKSELNVYDMFEYELRTAEIKDKDGNTKFKQENVEVPKGWLDTATKIVASRYFKRKNVKEEYGGNAEGSEQSVKHLVHRVSHTLRSYGEEKKYFNSKEEADIFEDELTYILLSQRAAFNSPVWFNLGLFHDYGIVEKTDDGLYYWDSETDSIKQSKDSYSHPQVSACFINSVGDYMFGDGGPEDHSIFKLVLTEAKLFKYGSGNGTNYSDIRAKGEKLSGGGESSGLISFLGILDSGSNAVKSGGKTRRAAKMVILNADHPDLEDFILWKVDGERKARALAAFGYDTDMDGLYRDLSGQNSNNSVRVKDEFMRAVMEDGRWDLIERTTGKVRESKKARALFDLMAKATWASGDPGIQYDTTINNWHTCPNTAPINASNPCSEYMFIDDSACNLASLNLMKYRNKDGTFNIKEFKHDVGIMIAAQEIAVDLAGYPTPSIARNSHDFRPLGLGYANLGALLMSNGMPYDSEEAFAVAGAITAIMTGEAYAQSSRIASRVGTFPGFEKNREPFLRVMKQHHDHVKKIPKQDSKMNLEELIINADKTWIEARSLIEQYGARNSQATVLAPTGTIGFMMDCDTTGVEPDIALVKYKQLVNRAGMLKLVNNTVPTALSKLGYNDDEAKRITDYIEKTDTIEGAPGLNEKHLPVFDCAFKPANGVRAISPMGHVRMMAAVQPFISGAISKTVNTPEDWTAKDIYDIYLQSWKLGLKAIAVYRDNTKLSQPLSVGESNLESKIARGEKRELPQMRETYTIELKIFDEKQVEHQMHIICGEYEDGTLGEIRVQMFDQGSTMQGMLGNWTVALSTELKYGVPLEKLVTKHKKAKFEPSGVSDYPYMNGFNSIPHLVLSVVGLEYMGVDKYIEVTGEEFIRNRIKDPDKLRVNKNRERLRFERYLEQIKKIDKVIESPIDSTIPTEKGENKVELNGQDVEYKTSSKVKSDGQPCPTCGNMVLVKGGCSHCSNCGEQVGGGCPS